jgi:hypothetical protein
VETADANVFRRQEKISTTFEIHPTKKRKLKKRYNLHGVGLVGWRAGTHYSISTKAPLLRVKEIEDRLVFWWRFLGDSSTIA